MDEVTKQLAPMSKRVESIDRWKLSLWSNGSGGPPGYLETARKEDDDRYARLFEKIEDLGEHKETVTRFITIFEEREQQKAKNRRLLLKIGAAVGSALLTLGGWLAHESAPVIKVLWDDYVKSHPVLEQQLRRQTSEVNHPNYAEDAEIPKVR